MRWVQHQTDVVRVTGLLGGGAEVEEDERPERTALRGRQQARDLEAATEAIASGLQQLQRVSDALQKALVDPGVRAKLEANGAVVVASKSVEYAQSLESEIVLTEKMMKAINVTAQ